MNKWLSRWPLYSALLLFIILTAVCTSAFGGLVNSPDEAANLAFARVWREEQSLFIAQPEGGIDYPVFPRSTVPVPGGVRPAGFVGVIIFYGTISAVVGDWALFYLTIFFTALGAVAWWYIVRHIFSLRAAYFAAWLWLFQPAVLYYAARGLFPNLLLMDLWLIAAAAAMSAQQERPRKIKILFILLAVFAGLLALVVRPPETILLLITAVFLRALWGNKKQRWSAVGVGAVVALLAGVLWWGRSRGWWPGGYQFLPLKPWEAVFPFGVHPRLLWSVGVDYVGQLFWIWSWLGIAAWLWWWQKQRLATIAAETKIILGTLLVMSVWVFVSYGSWRLADNPDATAVTMGVSYVRYFLPLWLGLSLGVAWILDVVAARLRWLAVGAVVILVVAGVVRALVGGDGLWAVKTQIQEARTVVTETRQMMPPTAVLAVKAWDKYFFPLTPVLQPFPQEVRAVAAARELLRRGTPVWALVRTWTDTDVLWLRDNGLIVKARRDFDQHVLYELKLWKK